MPFWAEIWFFRPSPLPLFPSCAQVTTPFVENNHLTVLETCLNSRLHVIQIRSSPFQGSDEVNTEDQVIVKRRNAALSGLVPTENVPKGKMLFVFLNKCMSCNQNRKKETKFICNSTKFRCASLAFWGRLFLRHKHSIWGVCRLSKVKLLFGLLVKRIS